MLILFITVDIIIVLHIQNRINLVMICKFNFYWFLLNTAY